MSKKKGLTPKQAVFVREYLIDLNATQAAIRAKYSKKTAGQQGERLLKNVEVAKAVQEAMDKRAAKLDIDSERILQEIARLAYIDPRKVFNEHGQLLPIHQLPDEIAVCIASIEVVTTRVPGGEPTDVEHTTKIKFWDKRGSLELLGRHKKLFTDKLEVEGSVTMQSHVDRLRRVKTKQQENAGRRQA